MPRLTDLPEELLLQLISLLDQESLLGVCLVTRRIGRIAQEVLYRSPVIDDCHMGYPIEKLATTLILRPEVADMVRSLTLCLAGYRPSVEHVSLPRAPYRTRDITYATTFLKNRALPMSKRRWIRRLRQGDEIAWTAILLKCAPKLETLDLNGADVWTIHPRGPNEEDEAPILFTQEDQGGNKGPFDLIRGQALRLLRVRHLQVDWAWFEDTDLEQLILGEIVRLPPHPPNRDPPDVKVKSLELGISLGSFMRDWDDDPFRLINVFNPPELNAFLKTCISLKILRLDCARLFKSQHRYEEEVEVPGRFAYLTELIRPVAPTLEFLEFIFPDSRTPPNWLSFSRAFEVGTEAFKPFTRLKKLIVPAGGLTDPDGTGPPLEDLLPDSLETLGILRPSLPMLIMLEQLFARPGKLSGLRDVRFPQGSSELDIEGVCAKVGDVQGIEYAKEMRARFGFTALE